MLSIVLNKGARELAKVTSRRTRNAIARGFGTKDPNCPDSWRAKRSGRLLRWPVSLRDGSPYVRRISTD